MASGQSPIENVWRLAAQFTDQNAAPADPTTVTLTLVDPTGISTTPDVTQDGTGSYHYDLLLTLPGRYRADWNGAGACVAQSGPDYITAIPV